MGASALSGSFRSLAMKSGVRQNQMKISRLLIQHLPLCDRFPQIGKQTSIYCTFGLDTTIPWLENPITQFGRGRFKCEGGCVRYLPGWTVQCINPECQARGHWLRADNAPEENCSNCGEHLHNVPPPLSPQLRLRPRPLTTYRPNRRAR
jgi:hypothetical protein